MKVATVAPTAGVISDSRASVGTIIVFEVNRIVYSECLEGWICVRETYQTCVKKVANAGVFKYSYLPPNLRDKMPSH